MKLSELKTELNCPAKNFKDLEVAGISIDSRKVSEGDLFVCLRGVSVDRHDFAEVAVQKGAAALLVERWLDHVDVPQLLVNNCRGAWALSASLYFGKPSKKLRFIGVTGTNGKTTTAHMINHVLNHAGYKTAVMGTVGTFIDGKQHRQSLTTPDPIEFDELLKKAV